MKSSGSLEKKKFLVTGGAGFIGSHMAEWLLDRGYQVRVLDNLSQGSRAWLREDIEFIEGDITSIDACNLATEGIDGVFHMAAMSKVGPSIDRFEYCTEQNILGTQNILGASRKNGVKKLVYSGSSTYYGLNPAPHLESQLPNCLNPYALSKYVGEEFCSLYARLYGFPTVSLRYFNVYGPRQPNVGAYALVLGIFLERKSRSLPLVIHGSGRQRRDFIHVQDVVKANWAAYSSDVGDGSVFNVGSGSNVSVLELAQMISDDLQFEDRRAGDAEVTLADISKIKAILGWSPSISFEDGLSQLLKNVEN